MSNTLHLSAQVRTKIGKNANRQLRAKGVTPAVYYNATGESILLQVTESALNKVYGAAGRTTLVDLEIDNNGAKQTVPCLIWDVEYYPTKQRFQHVDFYGVDLDKEVKVRVPLIFTGTSKGVKAGGKAEVYRDRIDVWSKPATLPNKITVDISDLGFNQGLRVADLPMPEGVRPHYDDNFAIITINAPGSSTNKDGEETEE